MAKLYVCIILYVTFHSVVCMYLTQLVVPFKPCLVIVGIICSYVVHNKPIFGVIRFIITDLLAMYNELQRLKEQPRCKLVYDHRLGATRSGTVITAAKYWRHGQIQSGGKVNSHCLADICFRRSGP